MRIVIMVLFFLLFLSPLKAQLTIPINCIPVNASFHYTNIDGRDSSIYATVHTDLRHNTRLWLFYDSSLTPQVKSILLEYFFVIKNDKKKYFQETVKKQYFLSKPTLTGIQTLEHIDFLSTAYGKTTKRFRHLIRTEIKRTFPLFYASVKKILHNKIIIGSIRQSELTTNGNWLKALQVEPNATIYTEMKWLEITRFQNNKIIQRWQPGNPYESDSIIRTAEDNILVRIIANIGTENYIREFEYDEKKMLKRIVDNENQIIKVVQYK